MTRRDKKGELLLEIGTEEIPALYLESGISQLKNSFIDFFKLNAFASKHVMSEELKLESYQTSCRFILTVKGFRPFYEGEEKISGPKKKIGYTPDGKPTRALEGFLESNQASLKDLVEESERMVLHRTKRVKTKDVLETIIPVIIRRLTFPKMMRWDESGLRFPRPIRWLLCVYNGKSLSFKFGNLKAEGKTYGSGPVRKEKRVKHSKEYFAFLKKEGILLERCGGGGGGRKGAIRKRLEQEFQKVGGSPQAVNHALLNEVTNLVEKPVLFSGRFQEIYRTLPKEILIASMSKYQRLFSVENRKGELLPYFVACANGSPSVKKVKKSYEHVLNARLEDARFFFAEDTQEPFSQKRKRLSLLIYHQKLGTMVEKSERMEQLAVHFVKLLRDDRSLAFDEKSLLRACELAKNDLVTEMVKEFPSLQGIVGYYYARKSGEPEEVALAIREQYLDQPESPLGAALSFLEKLDHVVGCFSAGESPTGSSDPYALRRAANTLLKILLDQRWNVSLLKMVEESAALLTALNPSVESRGKLSNFLQDRLKTILREEGFREDLIEAVVRDVDHVVQVKDKLSDLKEMMEKRPEEMLAAFKVVERTHNILKPVSPTERENLEVQPALFQEEIEKNLWKLYNTHKDSVEKLIHEKTWAQATSRYGELFAETLHQFFEKVLVNVEDKTIRQNRLAMMKKINELYTHPVADLSKLMMSKEK